MIDQSEIFKDSLARVATRDKIASGLVEKRPTNQIIKEVRLSKTPILATKVAEDLSTREVSIDEKTHKLLTQIQKEVERVFPMMGDIGLVPLGSTLHGGRKVREILGTIDDTDLDLGVVCDYDQADKNQFHQLRRFIDDEVQRTAGLYGFSDSYHLCGAIDPSVYHFPNLHTQKDVLNYFKYPNFEDFSGEKTIIYFMESVPKKINQSNQNIILKTLHDISKVKPVLWKNYINEILKNWSKHHKLKPKHLIGKHTEDLYNIEYSHQWDELLSTPSKRLLEKVVRESETAMSQPLKDLLLSTAR